MTTIRVNLKNNPYPIHLGYDLAKKIPRLIKELNLGNQGIVVTSPRIYNLYKRLIKKTFPVSGFRIVKVADGERAKTKKWLFSVINEIVKADTWGKKVFLVCLGGGTIGDLGGLAASIYKRGTPCVQIPTTLLAQIDAAIGGKTAIDLPEAKNILGTFHQPRAVIIDPVFLDTLHLREIKQGMAEAIKYGIIKDKSLFSFLKEKHQDILALHRPDMLRLIAACVGIKAKIVEEDERETRGIRTILNFGHTFGHALEASLKYHRLSHGEAVALGMIYTAQLSLLLGKCPNQALTEIREIIACFHLPTQIDSNYATICKAISYDKKFTDGKVRMVLLKRIGEVEVVKGIPLSLVTRSIKKFLTKSK